MKTSAHSAVCIIGAVLFLGAAFLLDRWAFPTSYFNSEFMMDDKFLWRVTLPRVVSALPLGVLCWLVFRRRASIFVGVTYLLCSVPVLIAYLIMRPNASFDPFRSITPFDMASANVYDALVAIAALGIASLASSHFPFRCANHLTRRCSEPRASLRFTR